MRELLSLLDPVNEDASSLWSERYDTFADVLECNQWHIDIDTSTKAWIKPFNRDWGVFAQGYAVGATILVNWIIKTQWFNEPLVYPTLFLFRHYVELRLKELLELVRLLLNDEYSAPIISHSLDKVVNELDILLTKVPEWKPVDITWKKVKNVTIELQRMDPTSQVFRYHKDRNGNPLNLTHPCKAEKGITVTHIDLRSFSILMQNVTNHLDSMRDQLRTHI